MRPSRVSILPRQGITFHHASCISENGATNIRRSVIPDLRWLHQARMPDLWLCDWDSENRTPGRRASRRTFGNSRGTQGILAPNVGPPYLLRYRTELAECRANKETHAEKASSPWLLSRSRIDPPLWEVGLGKLAAQFVLPWRSSDPIPRATLDTDANAGRSRRIVVDFLFCTRHENSSGRESLH
jgi:hypothetical protein